MTFSDYTVQPAECQSQVTIAYTVDTDAQEQDAAPNTPATIGKAQFAYADKGGMNNAITLAADTSKYNDLVNGYKPGKYIVKVTGTITGTQMGSDPTLEVDFIF